MLSSGTDPDDFDPSTAPIKLSLRAARWYLPVG